MNQRDSRRSWALAALATNTMIVVTGALVRLTGSGLGCSDWPTCEGSSVLPPASEASWHTYIEFGNRLLTFVVLAASVGAWLTVRRHAASTRRQRLLAVVLPIGVALQAVVGGITVLTGLNPYTVMTHFLLSAVLIGVATLLVDALERPEPGPLPTGEAAVRARRVASAVPPVAALVLVLGTVVTGAGPHAGDPGTPRLGVSFVDVTRVHSVSVWTVTLLTVAVVVLARRAGDERLRRAGVLLLVSEVVQGAVGYTQFATELPIALVAVHVALACVFWVLAVRVGLAARRPSPSPDGTAPRSPAVVVGA